MSSLPTQMQKERPKVMLSVPPYKYRNNLKVLTSHTIDLTYILLYDTLRYFSFIIVAYMFIHYSALIYWL